MPRRHPRRPLACRPRVSSGLAGDRCARHAAAHVAQALCAAWLARRKTPSVWASVGVQRRSRASRRRRPSSPSGPGAASGCSRRGLHAWFASVVGAAEGTTTSSARRGAFLTASPPLGGATLAVPLLFSPPPPFSPVAAEAAQRGPT